MCRKSFLSLLAEGARRPHALRNLRNGQVVAGHLETAFDRAGRNKGLLGRSSLDPGTALVLAPCGAVHTFLMRFPIDVAFLTRAGRVAKIYRNLRASRLAWCRGAYGVIELAAGALELSDTQMGDRLVAEPGADGIDLALMPARQPVMPPAVAVALNRQRGQDHDASPGRGHGRTGTAGADCR